MLFLISGLQIFSMIGLLICLCINMQPKPEEKNYPDIYFYKLALADYEYNQKYSLRAVEFFIILNIITLIISIIF